MTVEDRYHDARRELLKHEEEYNRAHQRVLDASSALAVAEHALVESLKERVFARFDSELRDRLPRGCEIDVFISDNWDDDWYLPVAAQVDHPTIRNLDGYGLCDAGMDSVEEQCDYLIEQLIDSLDRFFTKEEA